MSMCFLSVQIWTVFIAVAEYAVGLIADLKKRGMVAAAVLYKFAVCIVQLCFNSIHFVFSPYCSFAEKIRKNIVGGVFINRKKRLVLLGFLYNRPEFVYRKILSFLRFSVCRFDAERIYAKKLRFFKVLYGVCPKFPRARSRVQKLKALRHTSAAFGRP